MNKIVIIAAVAALATLSACGSENVDVPVNETAAANIVLNDDGSVNTEASAEAAATAEATQAAQ